MLLQKITQKTLLELSAAARNNERKRKNHNLHASYDEPCQRFLNAVEPSSYIRPHRHLTPPKPETFLVVKGHLCLILFIDDGTIVDIVHMVAGGETIGVDLLAGAWHTLVSLEPNTIFFETKPGPYIPISDKDLATWSPAEGTVEVNAYLKGLEWRCRQNKTCG